MFFLQPENLWPFRIFPSSHNVVADRRTTLAFAPMASPVYLHVGNIPAALRSAGLPFSSVVSATLTISMRADLRVVFRNFIDEDKFECFHFKHRPEENAKQACCHSVSNFAETSSFL